MNLQMFLTLLLLVSALTVLTVEGIKKLLNESGRSYHSNLLAGMTAIVLSFCVGIGYEIFIRAGVTGQEILYLIALIFLSWLCSMVGYDKVVQAIRQFGITESEDK